ncbi:glycosyltransferase family 2 protein [uncultured Mucilaginibacter sp.]|uniref:glycosyltransferase family 2 protein n=1 Tax=uncultured Mucilaginibacter sp. TaxID=797541 RepID=UPI0025FC9D5A|nr:glycosyltransferase family 2 protein [uncultured Mucilaginibacter sp.]
MILTIAIPTYNRPDEILATVSTIIPQLNDKVSVIILDNSSDVNVVDHLLNEIENFDKYNITVHRNKVNIGPDANFARSFEYSTAQYTWVLGDDDEVDSNAVEKILSDIEYYKDQDLIGFNFNSNCNLVERTVPIIVDSTASLVSKMDFFGNWLFLSTSVYHTQSYLKYIRYAYWSAYSMASQISPALVAISNNKVFVFSEKYIVTNKPIYDVEQKWSNVKITLTLTSLLELPLNWSNKEYLTFGIKMNTLFVTFTHILVSILKSVKLNVDLIDEYHLYILNQIYSRTIEFRSNRTKEKVMYNIVKRLLKNKALLKLALRTNAMQKKAHSKDVASFNLFIR